MWSSFQSTEQFSNLHKPHLSKAPLEWLLSGKGLQKPPSFSASMLRGAVVRHLQMCWPPKALYLCTWMTSQGRIPPSPPGFSRFLFIPFAR